jgi:hypothetical protein
MSKDGPPSGRIDFDPWFKSRPIADVNADLQVRKLIRRATELRRALKAQGLSEVELLAEPELKSLVAELARHQDAVSKMRKK